MERKSLIVSNELITNRESIEFV